MVLVQQYEDVSPNSIRSDLYAPESLADFKSTINSRSSQTRRCPSIISVLSSLLERAVVRSERIPAPEAKKLSIFNGIRIPAITIQQYLERIFKYSNCSPSCFVVAYAYIDRLCQQPEVRITSRNVHRIIITSVLISAKFLDDMCFNNAYYAQIGGISTTEMNKLEMDFLYLLNFRLNVTVSVFESYCLHLEREVALGGGYQIEKTLKSICGLDDGKNKLPQGKTVVLRSIALRCSDGS